MTKSDRADDMCLRGDVPYMIGHGCLQLGPLLPLTRNVSFGYNRDRLGHVTPLSNPSKVITGMTQGIERPVQTSDRPCF
jgi:hypothetical protein